MITAAGSQSAVPVIDELGYDLVDLPGVSVEETVLEPLSRETYPESGTVESDAAESATPEPGTTESGTDGAETF